MPIRTLHLIEGLGTGGAERSLAELLPDLPAHGVIPTVVVRHRRDEGVERDVLAAGIPIAHVHGTLPTRVRTVRRLIRSLGIELVHTTLTPSNNVGRLATIGGPPLLTSLVNMPFSSGRRAAGNVAPWKLEVLRQVERAAVPLTTRYHAITAAVAQHVVEEVGVDPGAISIVPRGRSVGRLGRPDPTRRIVTRSRLGLGEDEFVIVNVGRQEPQKGQHVLIDALARLREQRGYSPTTLIAGREGSASASLARQVQRLRLEKQVIFLGHRDDVPDILSAGDLFVFPSLYEGLGGAVLEAMALRVPIIAGDSPAVREVLDDGRAGVLVPTGDVEALAEAILDRLEASADVTTLVEAASARFEARYNHEAVVEGMARLFHRVAEPSR